MPALLAILRRKWVSHQAARWHVRMQNPQSVRDVEAFEAWLGEDRAHAAAYADIETIMQAGLRASPARDVRHARGLALRPVFAIAMLIALVTFSTLLFAIPSSQPAVAAVSNVGPAVKAVSLSDGSELIVDVGGQIGALIAERERLIEFKKGRVRAQIGSKSSQPLQIVTPAGKASISQGIVDVTIEKDAASLTAISAPLSVTTLVANYQGTIVLQPGETIRLTAGGSDLPRQAKTDLDWPLARRGFERVALAEVVAMANRHGTPAIVLEGNSIANRRVSGVFDVRDTRRLAPKLAAALNLKVSERPGRIVLAVEQ